VLIKFNISRKIDTRLNFETELTYEDVTNDFNLMSENNINTIEPAGNKYEFDKNRNETVTQNISVFEANDIMENALREADDGNYEQARILLKDARGYMDQQMDDVSPSPEMTRQSENIDRYGKDLESAETKSVEEKKEMQKSGKYDNYNSRKKNE
jgi:hypothetical protein